MKFVLICGAAAVGKMTVGQELAKITDLRLFHNHMSIELALDVFGRGNFHNTVIKRIRTAIFEEFAKSDNYGMIHTLLMAFCQQSDWDYVEEVFNIFREQNAEIYFVELHASQDVRLWRNETENRLQNKASKRDIEGSKQRMLHEDGNYRLVSNDGEVPFENYIKIDNTNLAPEVVAKMIKDRFEL